jgi:hypothetical protein
MEERSSSSSRSGWVRVRGLRGMVLVVAEAAVPEFVVAVGLDKDGKKGDEVREGCDIREEAGPI